MSPELIWVLVVGMASSIPGLIAFWLLKRQGGSARETLQLRAEALRIKAEAEELLNRSRLHAELQQQLREQIEGQHRTIRFLTKRVDELEAARAREYIETEALRQENEALRQELAELRRGVAHLTRQMEAAQIAPGWSPPQASPPAKRGERLDKAARARLRQRIAELFTTEEINDLAFDLDIAPDDLSGTTALTRTRSLVSYMEDRDRLQELIDLCRRQRPDGGF